MPESGDGGFPATYGQRAGSWRDADGLALPFYGVLRSVISFDYQLLRALRRVSQLPEQYERRRGLVRTS